MKKTVFTAFLLVLFAAVSPALAEKCGTGLRSAREGIFKPAPPLARRIGLSSPRVVVPVPFENAQTLLTTHFQLVWGNDYDRLNPDWSDADADGIPLWVEVIAESLEYSFDSYASMGYPPPYGVGDYYIDVYIANTGVRLYSEETGTYNEIKITDQQNYLAYTQIDRDYSVAFFVFNDNFSGYGSNEIPALRATCAHELFHAVQRGAGYPWDAESPEDGPDYIDNERWSVEGWWIEASATWMEEEAYPEINDYASYVTKFLTAPQLPLFYFESGGVHQYGAAIFMGWVRLMSPGQETLLGILNEAYPQGLEPSIRKYVSLYSGDTLEDSVAKFWSLAIHPWDKWPDGALYVSATYGAPRIYADIASTPDSFDPPVGKAPGRFGANLYTVAPALLPIEVSLKPDDSSEELTLALSAYGSSAVTLPDLSLPLVPPEGGGAPAYAAVVNTSPGEGTAYYRFILGTPEGLGGGGSGGGCFLEALRFPLFP
ncbi:hypothetical protein EPN96_09720 [bacterium]|nr:MAG: hypothetical protein EPN96_09720 [bacterium]